MSELSALLSEIADRAKTYDSLDEAYVRGRRRRRVRSVATGGTVVVVVLATVVAVGFATGRPFATSRPEVTQPGATAEPTPAGPTACTLEILAFPSGYPSNSMITGGDPTGGLLVGRGYPDNAQRKIFVWDHGTISTVDMPGLDGILGDVNSSGVAIGSSWVDEHGAEVEVAWVYANGRVSPLSGGGAIAVPAEISDEGVIVGSVRPSDDMTELTPVVWRSPTAEPEPLPLPAGVRYGAARAITPEGDIIGMTFADDPGRGEPPADVIVWKRNGTMLSSPLGVANLEAVAGDWAAISAWSGRDHGPIYLWNIRTNEVRPSPVHASMLVNAKGWVVGPDDTGSRVLVADGPAISLEDLPGAGRGAEITYLSDDARTIGGYRVGDNGENIAAIWHCA